MALRADGSSWAIATPHDAATRAGAAAFERGGTAMDAAIHAAVTLAVAYPHMCGVGGDLFALVQRADGETLAINSSGRSPTGSRPLGAGRPRRDVDLIEIPRIARALERYPGFRERCFTDAERAYCDSKPNPPQHYAARFAGKEAVGKALARASASPGANRDRGPAEARRDAEREDEGVGQARGRGGDRALDDPLA